MSEQIYQDVFGENIVLADYVKTTILDKHPEVKEFLDRIDTVLKMPDEVRRSIHNELVVLYYCYEDDVLHGKWVVVVVKRIDRNYISTIYATDKVKDGEVIWKK